MSAHTRRGFWDFVQIWKFLGFFFKTDAKVEKCKYPTVDKSSQYTVFTTKESVPWPGAPADCWKNSPAGMRTLEHSWCVLHVWTDRRSSGAHSSLLCHPSTSLPTPHPPLFLQLLTPPPSGFCLLLSFSTYDGLLPLLSQPQPSAGLID